MIHRRQHKSLKKCRLGSPANALLIKFKPPAPTSPKVYNGTAFQEDYKGFVHAFRELDNLIVALWWSSDPTCQLIKNLRGTRKPISLRRLTPACTEVAKRKFRTALLTQEQIVPPEFCQSEKSFEFQINETNHDDRRLIRNLGSESDVNFMAQFIALPFFSIAILQYK